MRTNRHHHLAWPCAPPPAAQLVASQLAAGHAAFYVVLLAAQRLQLPLGVTTAKGLGLRLMPSLFGAAAVAGGSIASVAASDAIHVAAPHTTSRLDECPASGVAVTGVGLYSLLSGGRLWANSPSCLRSLGAFAQARRGSLPASANYATSAQREAIQRLGHRYGCHTCGIRGGGMWAWLAQQEAVRFNADHMPPLWDARRANAALWRRVLRRPVVQRFYPQCVTCSNKQGALLAALDAKRHVPRAARAVVHAPPLFAASSCVGALVVTIVLAAENGVGSAALLLEASSLLPQACARHCRLAVGDARRRLDRRQEGR